MLFASGVVVTGGGSCVRVCVCISTGHAAHTSRGDAFFLCVRVRVRVCLCAFRSFVVVIEGSDDDDDDVLSFRATS